MQPFELSSWQCGSPNATDTLIAFGYEATPGDIRIVIEGVVDYQVEFHIFILVNGVGFLNARRRGEPVVHDVLTIYLHIRIAGLSVEYVGAPVDLSFLVLFKMRRTGGENLFAGGLGVLQ